MNIKQFIDKWFKHWVHKEWIDMYFKVRGVSVKNLWRYIEANFGDTKINNGGFFEKMSVDEMDNYMEDLLELMD